MLFFPTRQEGVVRFFPRTHCEGFFRAELLVDLRSYSAQVDQHGDTSMAILAQIY